VKLSCFVEIPKGSRNKYEYDEARGIIKLDRHLFSSAVFPTDYGFLEGTRTDDGRHLDALVLVSEPTFPGCRIDVRPIGIFQMRDEAGVDDKVLCVPLQDPEWRDVHELDDVSSRIREEIEHFFAIYKDLEPEHVTAIEGWADRTTAEREIAEAQRRFADSVGVESGTTA
jgi:inorganic pyrophosphatase